MSIGMRCGHWLALFIFLGAIGGVRAAPPKLALERFAGGFDQPVFITHAGDGSGALYVVEQPGRIQVLNAKGKGATEFLDLRDLINTSGWERGLLGLAFDPDFKKNGRLFVYYTANNGDNTLAGLSLDPRNPWRADRNSLRVLFAVKDPASNHNGGMLAFGPDGYLYIGMGDGGRAGDPWGNAQNTASMLGKLHRIDTSAGDGYRIPDDNPYAKVKGARPEIWATGLRNPWRFSFDRETGDVWIADVGQDHWEEINLLPGGAPGGVNFGWNTTEGKHCFPPGKTCSMTGLTLPVAEYGHGEGCSVTGGYVYRGTALPGLRGYYVFGDYCTGRIWGLRRTDQGLERHRLLDSGHSISSFGEDARGELYLVDHKGVVYRVVSRD